MSPVNDNSNFLHLVLNIPANYTILRLFCYFISRYSFTYAALDTLADKEHCRYLHRRHKCTDVGYIFKPYFCLKSVLLLTLFEVECPLYDICFGAAQFLITRVLCAKLHPADRCYFDVKKKLIVIFRFYIVITGCVNP